MIWSVSMLSPTTKHWPWKVLDEEEGVVAAAAEGMRGDGGGLEMSLMREWMDEGVGEEGKWREEGEIGERVRALGFFGIWEEEEERFKEEEVAVNVAAIVEQQETHLQMNLRSTPLYYGW